MDREKNVCIGVIVCRLDFHGQSKSKRGYIAMLAVSKEYRKRKIGSTLVLMAIESMKTSGADEVHNPLPSPSLWCIHAGSFTEVEENERNSSQIIFCFQKSSRLCSRRNTLTKARSRCISRWVSSRTSGSTGITSTAWTLSG